MSEAKAFISFFALFISTIDNVVFSIYNDIMTRLFKKLSGFIWDTGNKDKNQIKHKVAIEEAEEVFFDSHYILLKDQLHSGKEQRFNIIGLTKASRLLTVAFTVRKALVRVISARPAAKKERIIYEKASQSPKV